MLLIREASDSRTRRIALGVAGSPIWGPRLACMPLLLTPCGEALTVLVGTSPQRRWRWRHISIGAQNPCSPRGDLG